MVVVILECSSRWSIFLIMVADLFPILECSSHWRCCDAVAATASVMLLLFIANNTNVDCNYNIILMSVFSYVERVLPNLCSSGMMLLFDTAIRCLIFDLWSYDKGFVLVYLHSNKHY